MIQWLYMVRNRKTDGEWICGSEKECAKALKVAPYQLRNIYANTVYGEGKRWDVFRVAAGEYPCGLCPRAGECDCACPLWRAWFAGKWAAVQRIWRAL